MRAYIDTVATQGGRTGLLEEPLARAFPSIEDELGAVTRGAPLCDQVHAALFESLISGRLRPGDRIVEREWAERLSVSRTPVRQAIQRLAQEGLLEHLRSGGYAISRPSIEDIVQIYEFRAVVERHTAEGAAGRTRTAALSRNLEAARDALAHRDADAAASANAGFHLLIAEACGQRHFIRAIAVALRWTAFYQRTLRGAPGGSAQGERRALQRLEQSVRDHQTIAGCLAAGDAAGAGRAMAAHLRAIGDQLAPGGATARQPHAAAR